MYGRAYGWNRQSWTEDPGPVNAPNLPYHYQPGIYQKRQPHTRTKAAALGADDDTGVCPAARELGGRDADGPRFVDMDGRPIEGQNCDIIYDDDDDDDLASRTRILVDEDGHVMDVYFDGVDANAAGGRVGGGGPITAATTATANAPAVPARARPGSSEASLPPASTTLTRRRMKTIVTVAPVVY